MRLSPFDIPSKDRYKIVTATILPRPIAWVSTISADGVPNLAPFSFFTVASSDPFTLLFSCSHKPDGSKKDTWVNAEASSEFVVNLTNQATAEAMNITATTFPHGVSEFDAAGLTPAPCQTISAPRVLEAPVSFECKLTQIVEVGGNAVIFGAVQMIHIDDAIYDGNYVNLAAMQPIGRLAGSGYCRVTDLFEMVRG
jgi:flavin reductase (DIM6/NTAB) family NADH-FMN oxidoreductase RutF